MKAKQPQTRTKSCPLVLFNTFTRRREVFTSLKPNEVKLFTCGPSIYRRPHLGNYRTFLYEDVLERYLEYRGNTVHRVIVVTDVEDKAIEEAATEGLSVKDLTDRNVEQFRAECDRLGIQLPGVISRASTSIESAVTLIEKLMEKGIAYRHGDDIFYDPLKYPGFGELFGLDMSNWPKERRRYAQDTYNGNRWNLGDFIVWHGYKEGDLVGWETRIGKGRPSWNVQDPAMCVEKLGYEIDIHCGGVDNLYRHHDYNRAIVEGITDREFCHYWLHGEHVIVDGTKMSKSLGNVLYLDHMDERKITAREVRFMLIYGYYRDKLNVTDALIDDRVAMIRGIRESIASLLSGRKQPTADLPGRAEIVIDEIPVLFETAMNDDLHVADAVDSVKTALGELVSLTDGRPLPKDHAAQLESNLRSIDTVLGSLFEP